MNLLDICIHLYGAFVFLKLILNAVLSTTLLIWSSVLFSQNFHCSPYDQSVSYNSILIGMIVSALVSLFYSGLTMSYDNRRLSLEIPRLFILIWAIYSTVELSTHEMCRENNLTGCLILNYLVAFLNLFIMRYPYGDDGEIRT